MCPSWNPAVESLSAYVLALPGFYLLSFQVAERAEARFYADPAAMQDDVRQVFRNCELYNPPGSDIRFLAQGLEVSPTLAVPDRVPGFSHCANKRDRILLAGASNSLLTFAWLCASPVACLNPVAVRYLQQVALRKCGGICAGKAEGALRGSIAEASSVYGAQLPGSCPEFA